VTLVANRYRVLGRLGEGGAGEVLRVRDERTSEELALKRLVALGRADELRMKREYHTLAGLRHPNVVEVRSFGMDEHDTPYYTMELLDGRDLREAAPMPIEKTCRVLADVASALAFLHTRNLVHRDVSPRNVCLARDGRAVLTDFGVLATMGRARDIAGTPPCIPPEALRRLPLDQRTDLFALGALGYFLLAGRFPYAARSLEDLEDAWRARPAPLGTVRKDMPAALDELILSLTSLDPLARPSSAHEVLDRLGALVTLDARDHGAPTALLGSGALVGRRRTIERLRDLAQAAARGTGAAVLVEGPAGMGCSRLLAEVGVDAAVAGAVVLTASGESADRGAYGVLGELAYASLREAHDDAVAAARPHAAQLVRILPALGAAMPDVSPERSAGDPAEERLRFHDAAVRWIFDLAARRPLAVIVDDAERIDEASASVLASLAHHAREQPCLVAIGMRTDDRVRAPTHQIVGAEYRVRYG
jgi:hypothetical protein